MDCEGEKIYLGSKSRLGSSQGRMRSYGSCTSRHSTPRANVRVVRHRVTSGDTLQGLALKYGVTMEDIKRENRMWTTDSLFLRESLEIPVQSSEAGTNGTHREPSPNSPQRTLSLDTSRQDEENIRDFLGRIDTSIKKTKSQIKELNVTGVTEIPSDLALNPGLSSQSYQNGNSQSLGDVNARSFSSVDFAPKTTVVTSGRKVKTSLQKHRREHEQMFEL